MANKFGKDLSVGNARNILIGMWIPLLIGTLLTMGYSIINAIWVGKIMGSTAMGGVAVTMPIIQLMTALSSGLSTATSILISQFFGAKAEDLMKKAVFHAWVVAVVLIIVVTGGGILFCDQLLRAMGTPEGVLGITSGYMKIIFASFIFSTLFSVISSILRGVGDTKKPMGFVIISTLINAVLDPLLIMGAGPIPKLGLNGAGYASLLSAAITCILGFLYMRKNFPMLFSSSSSKKIDFKMIGMLLKIGFPTTLQQLLFSISSIFIVTFVNAFGVAAIAAYGAVTKLESFITLPAMAMSMALAIITGQNLGAGKPERVHEFFKSGVAISTVYTILVSLIMILFPQTLLSMFLNDPTALNVGVTYFHMVGYAYLLVSITFVPNGIINGAGKTIVSLALSFVSICLIRIPLAVYLEGTSMGIKGIWDALIISYGLSTIFYMIYYILGKWKNNATIKNSKPIETETAEQVH